MQKKPRVLIVDSSTDGLSELERLLGTLDVDILKAASDEKALLLAQQYEIDAAVVQEDGEPGGLKLLGIRLPGGRQNGRHAHGLVARLRAHPAAEALPVILLTPGTSSEEELRQAYQAGAADVLPRQLAKEVLVGKLNSLLARHGPKYARRQEEAAIQPDADAGELFRWLSESMEQIAQAMASSLDMAEVPRLVLEQLPSVVPYERGSILLREGDALWIVAQRGFPENWPASEARIAIREGDVFQQIVETREALLIDDVTKTTAWSQAEGLPLDRSWLGVPLLSKDQVIGMVSLTRREAGAFEPREVALLRASASQAAVALVNASLLNDLKRFNEQLEQLVAQRTEELKNAYSRLEKINQAKSSFISITAHELRTPLTLISGYASLLSTLVKNNREAAELVEGITNGEKRLLDVVNDMVDVSKIDYQILSVRKSTVNLLVTLKILQIEFENALKDRKIKLVMNGLDSLPVIQADSELAVKMFRQLLGNAIKYTPDGGKVTITGRAVSENGRPAVELQIHDTGIGIDPAYHEVIFEKFYQMGPMLQHSSGKTKFKGGGPGLGLAIARGIVEAHEGRIWVESPGHDEERFPGSTFFVVIPVNG